MIIGITESGDPSIDFSWTSKVDNCDGVILITKNVSDKLISQIMKYKDKIILHATCTGMGGTIIEPYVPTYEHQLAQVSKLLAAGFPKDRIIVRIDPIIPTTEGLHTAQKVIDASPIKHFRISALDAYPHVRSRFKTLNIPLPYGENFQPSEEQFHMMRMWLARQNMNYIFDVCAEPHLAGLPNVRAIGCVSDDDIMRLNLPVNNISIGGYQRKDCLCLSCKHELLSNKKRCTHSCAYCYWKG